MQTTSPSLRRALLGAASAGALSMSALPFTAGAQTAAWPNRPLKIIVPFAPGGSSDFIARLISKPLGDALGQTVIVENRPGNAGNLGAAIVAQATDGHTVMLSDVGSLAISPLVNRDLNYKVTDLQGVGMLGYSPYLLAVNPNLPVNSLADLVKLSQTRRINVASAGSGSPNHLGVVEIALATGLKWQHVPYKGGAQALADTAAGNTDVLLNGMLATLPLVQGGRLRAIAVSRKNRVPQLPAVSTVSEQGVAGFEAGTYQGVTAPASLPRAHVAKLNAALIGVIRAADSRARMVESGAEVLTSTPEEISAFLKREEVRWSAIIKRAGNALEGTGA
jgi:tripartite-type tricarboxylate transporter receptor subunit TctC